MRGKRWTQDEVDYLVRNTRKMTAKQMADALGRDDVSVKNKVKRLREKGIIPRECQRMHLIHAERLRTIIGHIDNGTFSARSISVELGISESQCYSIVYEAREAIRRRNEMERQSAKKREREIFVRSFIRDNYNTMGTRDIAKSLGLSDSHVSTVIRKMKRDGLLPDKPLFKKCESFGEEIEPMTYDSVNGRLSELEEQFDELTERIANAPTLEDAMRLMDARNRIGCEMNSFANRKPDDCYITQFTRKGRKKITETIQD